MLALTETLQEGLREKGVELPEEDLQNILLAFDPDEALSEEDFHIKLAQKLLAL